MAAKTYLTLVNDLRIETGASGGAIATLEGTLPAEHERLKRWVRDAWIDIQNQHTNWKFLFVESSYTLAAGARVLAQPEFTAGDVAEWVLNSFKIAEPGEGRKDAQYLEFVEYERWRDNQGADMVTQAKPDSFTEHPTTEGILVSPVSDDAYVLFYDYWKTPQILTANTDKPAMPARYHDLVTAWAMRKYGYHEVASEKITAANEIIGRLFPQLEGDQLPEVTFATLGE